MHVLPVDASERTLRRVRVPSAIERVYPNTGFGNALRSAAALIKADVGVEAVHAFNGGWDTHATQGTLAGVDGQYMHNKMLELSNTLAAFYADVIQGTTSYGVTVVVISEFGRNARENGNRGTDHGRGNVAYAMGKKIAGGKVLTNGWPRPRARESRVRAGSQGHVGPSGHPRRDRAEPARKSELERRVSGLYAEV